MSIDELAYTLITQEREKVIGEVLAIIDTSQTYKMTADDPDTYIDKRVLREAVEELKE